MRPSKRLMELLTSPSHVANALDWTKNKTSKHGKAVAAMHIGRDRIGVAIASHPEAGEIPLALPPVRLELVTKANNEPVLAKHCVRELARICEEHNVGCFVVAWPVQKEGRPGASCGKVLHTLESLVAESKTILTKRRPLCLWMGDSMPSKDHAKKYEEDEWGRCTAYSRVSNKTIHYAKEEQYCFPKGSSNAAVRTWQAFCLQYWPNIQVTHRDFVEHVAVSAKVRQKGTLLSGSNSFSENNSQPNHDDLSMQVA